MPGTPGTPNGEGLPHDFSQHIDGEPQTNGYLQPNYLPQPNGAYQPHHPPLPADGPPMPPSEADLKYQQEVLCNIILNQIGQDLKKIVSKDMNKKMTESVAFKVYETWWDENQVGYFRRFSS